MKRRGAGEQGNRSALRELLPWYVNGTLGVKERQAVERWLREDPQAAAELADWQRLQAALAGQPLRAPSPALRRQVLTRAHGAPARPFLPGWAWGVALAVVALALLWFAVRPGVVLQWSVNDGPLSAFRVYRAPVGSGDFVLLDELPARPDARQYTYVDARLLPWQDYVYRVEGVGQAGALSSPAITVRGLEALPAQAAVLLASLFVGCAAALLIPRWRPAWRLTAAVW